MQSQFFPLFHGLRNHRNVVPTFRERTKRIAAFCRALSWPKTNLGYKIRVLDLSESLAYVHTKRYFRTGGNRINVEGNDESTLVEFIKIKNSRKNNNFLLCCCVRDTKRRKIDDKF